MKLKSVTHKLDGLLIKAAIVAPMVVPALAEGEGDVFTQTESGFKGAYGKLLSLSTPVCAVIIIVSLLVAHLGGEKSTEKGRSAAIKTGITWAVINGLGLFMNFVEPYLNGYSNIGF